MLEENSLVKTCHISGEGSEQVYFCHKMGVKYTSYASSCLGNLFLAQPNGVLQQCGVTISKVAEKVVQVEQNRFLVYTSEPYDVLNMCPSKDDPKEMEVAGKIHLENYNELKVKSGCTIRLNTATLAPTQFQQ